MFAATEPAKRMMSVKSVKKVFGDSKKVEKKKQTSKNRVRRGTKNTGIRSNSSKKASYKNRLDKAAGRILFGAIFLFVLGGIIIAFLPCAAGYRTVQA